MEWREALDHLEENDTELPEASWRHASITCLNGLWWLIFWVLNQRISKSTELRENVFEVVKGISDMPFIIKQNALSSQNNGIQSIAVELFHR